MIGYKDMTFCPFGDKCASAKDCLRVLTPEDKEDAEKWWGGKDFPVSYFTNPPECYEEIPCVML